MHRIGHYLGVPLQVEVVVCIVFGICFSIFDASLLDLNTNLQKVWAISLDEDRFSERAQLTIKYLLTGILLVRSFSVHVYLAFYIVMLWPVIFEDKPGLLIPWLIVGAVKSIGMSLLSTGTGLFVCSTQGLLRPVCLDFFLAQMINNAPSVYVWFVVLSFYEELKNEEAFCLKVSSEIKHTQEAYESELAVRRRRARSMTERHFFNSKLDDGRNLISASTIENMLQQLSAQLDRKTSRSLDTLLGLMAAEAEKEDILSVHEDFCAIDESLSVQDRTAKMLKLTEDDIETAKKEKEERNWGVFTEDSLEWLKSISITFFEPDDFPPSTTGSLQLLKPTEQPLQLLPKESEKEVRVIGNDSTITITASTISAHSAPKPILKPPKAEKKDFSVQVSGLTIVDRTEAVGSAKNVSPKPVTKRPKSVTFSKEPLPVETQAQAWKKLSWNFGSFREDGYVSAYKEQRRSTRKG